MNYIKSIIIFILVGLFNPLYAINGDSPFQCDAIPYMVIGQHSMLEEMDRRNFVENNISYIDAYDENVTINNLRVNGIAYNILDNYIYGRVTTEYNTTSGNSEHNLSIGDIIRLEKDGNITRIGHDLNGTNVHGNALTEENIKYKNSNLFTGTMDSKGIYYTLHYGALYRTNIEQNASQDSIKDKNITRVVLKFLDSDGQYKNAWDDPLHEWREQPLDITFNVKNKKIYGLALDKNDTIRLYSIDTILDDNQAKVRIVDVSLNSPSLGHAGGAWSTSNGTLYFYQNATDNSNLYKVDVSSTPATITKVSDEVNDNKYFDATACRPPYVTKKAQERFVSPDSNLTYTFEIHNPFTKEINVTFTDNLVDGIEKFFPSSLTSANGGTTSFTSDDKNLTIKDLTLPADGMVEFNITVKIAGSVTADTNLSNIAFISYGVTTMGSDDPVTSNIDDGTIVTVAPSISISDKSQMETNSSTTNFIFDINLSSPIGSSGGSVDYYIVPKDTDSSDLNLTQKGTIYFASGEQNKTITILVNGDSDIESNEEFYIILNNKQNISSGDNNATATILNDDIATISIADISANEGNSSTTNFDFNISIDKISNQDINVTYTTDYNGSTDATDFDSTTNEVKILAGQTWVIVTIAIKGDTTVEANEKFNLNLTNPINAIIGDNQAVATIINDDVNSAKVIVANSDSNNSVNSFEGGVAISNITLNDELNGTSFTLGSDVNITNVTNNTIMNINKTTGEVTIPANTPANTYNETYTICENAYPTNCTTATVSVTVISSTPIATNDGKSALRGSSVKLNILSNDSDNQNDINKSSVNITTAGATDIDGDGDKDSLVVVGEGSWSIDNITGEATFTPEANFSGNPTPIKYEVKDNTNLTSNQATISITYNDLVVPNTVEANDDNVTMYSNSEITIIVLDNDNDPDGDSFSIKSFDTNSTNGGEISVDENGSLVYKPAKDFIGSDSFTYQIKDSNGNIDSATVKIEILPMPIANDDSVTTPKNSSINIEVLDNDIDLNSNELNISSITNPFNGTVILEDNNSITYIPNLDFIGNDSFIYTIVDINGTEANATVNITIEDIIEDINNTTSNEDNSSVEEDDNTTSNESNSSIKEDNNSTTNENNTTIKDTTTPPTTQNNTTLPVAVDDIAEGKRDEVVTIDVLANDITAIGFDLTSLRLIDNSGNKVSYIDIPNEGEWIVNDNGTITFTPISNFRGETTPVGYTVDEITGRPVTSTALIYLSYPEVKDDIKEDDNATAGVDSIEVDIFTNDPIEDPVLSTLQIIGTSAPLEPLIVDGEGTWSIEGDKIIFTPQDGFLGDPTPIEYIVENTNGDKTNPAVVEVYYPIKARDNHTTTTQGKAVDLDILSDDNGNLDRDSIELVIPNGLKGIAILSDDNKTMIVPNEGVWEVLGDGMVMFTPNNDLTTSPTAIEYIVYKKNRTRVAGASIFVELRAIDATCGCGQQDSVDSYNILYMMFIFIFTILFVRREERNI